MNHRRGAILIISIGLCAMMAALALGFIARTRVNAAEMNGLVRVTQARLMLSAACAYVLESGRIGWDLSDTFVDAQDNVRASWSARYPSVADATNAVHHEEAFGWVDVRNGQVGPLTLDYDGDGAFDRRYDDTLRFADRLGGPLVRPAWPAIGGICRAPMTVLERPPFAVDPSVTPNRINPDPAAWDFGLPLLRNPDGQPMLSSALSGSATQAQRWDDWMKGDPAIRPTGDRNAWFRLLRDTPATFIATVACGGTRGYRSWDEVEAEGASSQFGNSRQIFEAQADNEIRLWYRIEWNPAIAGPQPVYNPVSTPSSYNGWSRWATYVNQAGTISMIQRLPQMPVRW